LARNRHAGSFDPKKAARSFESFLMVCGRSSNVPNL